MADLRDSTRAGISLMTNLALFRNEFRAVADVAAQADGHIHGDSRAARSTLKVIVHWLYLHERCIADPRISTSSGADK